jgi:hypothetical protein
MSQARDEHDNENNIVENMYNLHSVLEYTRAVRLYNNE